MTIMLDDQNIFSSGCIQCFRAHRSIGGGKMSGEPAGIGDRVIVKWLSQVDNVMRYLRTRIIYLMQTK